MDRRGGRRPGTTQTREAILAAARRSFAERGYADTTIRRIAGEAEVDPALVMHFFGNKDALFAAALRASPPIGDLVEQALDGDLEELGERLVRGYLERWENSETGPWMGAVVRAASESPSASAMMADFMTDAVMLPLARHIGSDEAELRANLAGAQVFGLAMVRYVLKVEPLASLERERVVARVAPVVQHYLTSTEVIHNSSFSA